LHLLQGMHPTLDLENQKGKVNEWLDNEPVAHEVRRQFRKFLRTFKDDNGERLYMRVMENMVLGEWGCVASKRWPSSSSRSNSSCSSGSRGWEPWWWVSDWLWLVSGGLAAAAGAAAPGD
jgi:hypothetical protein